MDSEPIIAWPKLANFVRQHTHDVRNGLNGLDLEAALLADFVQAPEGVEGIARIRAQIRKMAAEMKALSARFSEPAISPVPIAAREMLAIWQDQHATLDPKPAVEWQDGFADETVQVDPAAIADVMKELLVNARDFGSQRMVASGRAEKGAAIYELREIPPAAVETEGWGCAPFHTGRRGGYGLGLFSAHRAVAACEGRITHGCVDGTLATRLSFPLA
jgi:hypothetical protein